MKIETFSIVAGSRVCNAKCPFCVSRMTGLELDSKEPTVNWRNFEKACQLAKLNNVTTALITGKGEPTLFPDQITKYLQHLVKHQFPFVEIQTNGLMMSNGRCDKHLVPWYELGMSTIALSLVHYTREQNQKVYQFTGTEHYDLAALINKLHTIDKDRGFSVRLTVMLLNGFIDSVEELENLVNFCKDNRVEQLTLRPIRKPNSSHDEEVSKWVGTNCISSEAEAKISEHIGNNGNLVMTLSHGAKIYDFKGQNVCLADCLTIQPDTDHLRQLIFFPDGSLRYDWQYPGARLL